MARETPWLFRLWLLIVLVTLAALAFYVVQQVQLQRFLADDALITASFARNFVQGFGLVPTPGSPTVEGYSSPLWLILSALVIGLGAGSLWAVKGLSIAAGALCLIFAGLFAFTMVKKSPGYWPLIALPLFLTTDGMFQVWSASGMETVGFALVLVASAWRLIIEWSEPDRRPVSALLLFVVAITRPEGAIYVAVVPVIGVAVMLVRREKFGTYHRWWAALFFGLLGAYHIGHYLIFADLLPNTAYAKLIGRHVADLKNPYDPGRRYVVALIGNYALIPVLAGSLLALFSKKLWPVGLVLFCWIGFALSFPMVAGGDWMPGFRFGTTVVVTAILATLLGLGHLQAWMRRRSNRQGLATGVVIAAVITALVVVMLPASKNQFTRFKARPAPSYQYYKQKSDYYATAREKLGYGPYQATLAAYDMGVLTTFPELRVIDLGRLCSLPMAVNAAYPEHYQRFMEEYILDEMQPEFLILHTGDPMQEALIKSPRLGQLYKPMSTIGAPKMLGYLVRYDVKPLDAPGLTPEQCTEQTERARALFAEGKTEEAGDLLVAAREENPRCDHGRDLLKPLSWEAYKQGRLLEKQQQWEPAYQAYRKAVRYLPSNTFAAKRAEKIRIKRY